MVLTRSIAFGIPTGAVDGNVQRVFSRLFLISTDFSKKEGKTLIWFESHSCLWLTGRNLANELVDPDKPGHFNQAVMVLVYRVSFLKLGNWCDGVYSTESELR